MKSVRESLRQLTPLRKFITFDPIKDLDMNKKVVQFSLMCSGTYHTTPVVHDIFFHDSIEFQHICNQITLTIEWDGYELFSDVTITDNQLEKRSNQLDKKDHKYDFYHDYIPSGLYSDSVGDTEVLGNFLEKYDITDVNWVGWWENPQVDDCLGVSRFKCTGGGSGRMECVPANAYAPMYMWTRYPEEISELTL